jgi:hypothetical protein
VGSLPCWSNTTTGGLGGEYDADPRGSHYRNVCRRPRHPSPPIHRWTGDANGRDDARMEYYSTGPVGLFFEHRTPEPIRVTLYFTLTFVKFHAIICFFSRFVISYIVFLTPCQNRRVLCRRSLSRRHQFAISFVFMRAIKATGQYHFHRCVFFSLLFLIL